MRTNKQKLVKQALQGQIKNCVTKNPYFITNDGDVRVLPAMGGITYNVKIGDSVYGWEGDHIEPGVTIKHEEEVANDALNLLSCIGNEAVVVSGDAKGTKGYVTGKHGGVEHILIHFNNKLEDMTIEDKILVKAYGQGLTLLDFPEIKIMNIDPNLLLKTQIKEENGVLKIPVTAIVPAYLMGSGIGEPSCYRGDYDIMTTDKHVIKENNLDKLKFGDIVLLQDCDNTYGRGYLKGAVSVGVVIHSDCVRMGHGPGVTTIMTSKKPLIEGIIDPKANIGNYMNN